MISTRDFTIIIPCIKYEDVKETLKKIRNLYKNVRIIVCLNSIRKKNTKQKNIKFIVTKTSSIAEKRNISVNKCKSKYIIFLDSDAYPNKNWIESTFKFFKKKKNCIIAGPHVDPPNQNENQEVIGLIKKSFLITMKPEFQKDNNKKAQYISFIPSANWFLERKFFNSLGQMDPKLLRNEDWDFVYRMKKKNYKLFYSPKTLVFHGNSTIKHFIKKRYIYGYHMWPILKQMNIENYYFFLPLLFALFLLSFPLGFVFKIYSTLYASVLSFYFIVVFIETLRLCKKFKNFFKMVYILISANISPGFGILFGFFNFFNNEKNNK